MSRIPGSSQHASCGALRGSKGNAAALSQARSKSRYSPRVMLLLIPAKSHALGGLLTMGIQ